MWETSTLQLQGKSHSTQYINFVEKQLFQGHFGASRSQFSCNVVRLIQKTQSQFKWRCRWTAEA